MSGRPSGCSSDSEDSIHGSPDLFLCEVRLALLVCSGIVSGATGKFQRLLECSVVTLFSWGNTRNFLVG